MVDSSLMKDYKETRKEGEAYIQSKHLVSTIIRPWYVVGPGHLWPLLLLPAYGIANLFPYYRKKAEETSLITIRQMLHTIMKAIESPPQRQRVFEIKHIKRDSLPTI